MQNNIITAKADNYDVVFKLQGNTLVVELTCNEKDFMLAAKYTTDSLPYEAKYLFKTPAKLFAKLSQNMAKKMSVDSENQLLIPFIIFDNEQVIVPLPVSNNEHFFQLKTYDREQYLYFAKIAERARRFEQMVECMNKVVNANASLTQQERKLLSSAYQNTVYPKRTVWKALSSIEKKEEQKQSMKFGLLKSYKIKVEGELNKYINEILHLIKNQLLIKSPNVEAQVFYYKLMGDYYRYICGYTEGAEHNKARDNAHEAYKEATEKVDEASFKAIHPLRLSVALSYSLFHYQVKKDPLKACQIAKKAYSDGIQDYKGLIYDQTDNSRSILRQLRDFLESGDL